MKRVTSARTTRTKYPSVPWIQSESTSSLVESKLATRSIRLELNKRAKRAVPSMTADHMTKLNLYDKTSMLSLWVRYNRMQKIIGRVSELQLTVCQILKNQMIRQPILRASKTTLKRYRRILHR